MRLAGQKAHMGEEECTQSFIGNSEGNRPLGRCKCRRVKIDHKERGWSSWN
jgi:hypothetical protein